MAEREVQVINNEFVKLFSTIEKSPDARELAAQAAKVFEGLLDPAPEDFVAYWGVRWGAFGTLLKRDVPVSAIDRSHAEIRVLRKEGVDRTLVFRPEGITLHDLGIIHPDMRIWTTYPGQSVCSDSRTGWLDIENVVRAPNLHTSIKDLNVIAEQTGRYGMTLETYIIGSEDRRARTGVPFDNNYQTISRLPGSRYRKDDPTVLDASFVESRLLFKSYGNASQGTLLGGRFEGVKSNK